MLSKILIVTDRDFKTLGVIATPHPNSYARKFLLTQDPGEQNRVARTLGNFNSGVCLCSGMT